MNERNVVQIDCFSDVLCIWAYGAQAKLDELKENFGPPLALTYRYIPLFGDTESRIGEGWRDRGGFAGFNRHVRDIAAQWDHAQVHPEVWLRNVPPSSAPAHLFLKAVQHLEATGELDTTGDADATSRSLSDEAAWRLRERFFRHAEDIATRPVQENVAHGLELPVDRLRRIMESGHAHAAAHLDTLAKEGCRVPGSPCFVLSEGRRRLYGNVGYRIIEANVLQLLQDPHYGEATWC